jgi:cell wall-associated NlpC family hydrolase
MTRIAAALAGLVGLLAVLVGAAGGGADTGTHPTYPCPGAPPDRRPSAGDAAVLQLDGEQVATAGVILDVAAAPHLPPRAPVIAIATALQESRLRNLRGGDRDSLGVFQQRPSQGWGTPEQILDPAHAAAAFYDRLLRVPGWDRLPLTRAAQTVQRSARPDAYARWEPLATRIVDTLIARDCAQQQVPVPAVPDIGDPGTIAAYTALGQLGVPYAWGGGNATGPTRGVRHGAGTVGFDCSGLTLYAWAQTGVSLAHHSATQWRQGRHVPLDQLRPGDLVFFAANPADPATIHHVGLYLTAGIMIHAPRTGDTVRTEQFTSSRYWTNQLMDTAVRPGPRPPPRRIDYASGPSERHHR